MENEEMVHGEHFTVLSSEFNDLLTESRDLSEKDMLEHTDIEAKSENGLHGRSSDGAEDGVMQKEAHTLLKVSSS
ncbi:UNVERIFIED_CONTAM: hypothetical protein Sradi_2418800 [Sesamum radiatum]|uniref:Uncharacterized protein n=1 Tax=Sesamum radiatum TaxID=300843 RepID=A0AAW2SHK8_SESRA